MRRDEAIAKLPRYFQGTLSDVEREQLFDLVLEDQEIYNSFSENQVIADLFTDPSFRSRLQKAASASRVHSDVFRFRNFISHWRVVVGVAIACALIAIFVSKSSLRPPPPYATREPEPRRMGDKKRPSGTLTMLLVPPERHITGCCTLVLSPLSDNIHLELDVTSQPGTSFIGTLENLAGSRVADFGELSVIKTAARSRRISIEFSSELLKVGDYVVKLYRSNDAQKLNIIEAYTFRVINTAK